VRSGGVGRARRRAGRLRREIDGDLETLMREAKEAGARLTSARTLTGVPWHEIVRLLETEPTFDLAIVGTHGRTGSSACCSARSPRRWCAARRARSLSSAHADSNGACGLDCASRLADAPQPRWRT
jgi:hypothetical protein